MTRKDYQLIADALLSGKYEGMDKVRSAIHSDYCRSMADALAADNPKFDRDTFLKACGID